MLIFLKVVAERKELLQVTKEVNQQRKGESNKTTYLGKYGRLVKKKKKRQVFASPVKSDVLKTSLVLRVIIRKLYFLWKSWASMKHNITSKSAHHTFCQ